MDNNKQSSDERAEVNEAEALLEDSFADRSDRRHDAKRSAELNDNANGRNYRPESEYLFAEAQRAAPNTAAERRVENIDDSMLAANSLVTTTDQEALEFERKDERQED